MPASCRMTLSMLSKACSNIGSPCCEAVSTHREYMTTESPLLREAICGVP